MLGWRPGAGILVMLLYLGALSGRAQENAPAPPVKPAVSAPGQKKAAVKAAEEPARFTGEGLLAVGDGVKEGETPAGMILMTPEKYQEMKQRLEELKRQLKTTRLRPHSCRLSGHLEGEFVQLEAVFVVVTEQPGAFVSLGLKGSFLVDASLDGELPLLDHDKNEGFILQVLDAGKHQLTMQLKVPITTSNPKNQPGGSERGFVLGLAASAVMPALQLHLPGSVQEIRWNKYVEKRGGNQGEGGQWHIPIPADTDTLQVFWKESAPSLTQQALLTAYWKVALQLQEQSLLTTAHLTVKDLQGKTGKWLLLLPERVKAEDITLPENQGYTVERDGKTGLFAIQGPPTPQLSVVVASTQPRAAGHMAVGPYLLLDADQQQGDFEVFAAPEVLSGQRLEFHPHGDLQRQDLPAENGNRDLRALFKSWNLLHGLRPQTLRSAQLRAAIPPALELAVKSLPAQVETTVAHELHLQASDKGWQLLVLSTIQATPRLNGADFLDVQLPLVPPPAAQALSGVFSGPGLPFPGNLPGTALALALPEVQPLPRLVRYWCTGDGSASSVDLQMLPGPNKARIHLRQIQDKSFKVTLGVIYTLPPGSDHVDLPLTRPLPLLDNGGALVLNGPESLELLPPESPGVVAEVSKQHLQLHWLRAPRLVTLAWRPSRPEVPVTMLADITLRGRDALVRQQIQLAWPRAPGAAKGKSDGWASRQIQLVFPAGLSRRPTIIKGGEEVGRDLAHRTLLVQLTPGEPLLLQYIFPLPSRAAEDGKPAAAPNRFSVPLLWPAAATSAETTVRLWGDSGQVPTVPAVAGNEFWVQEPVAAVADRTTFPMLVLKSERLPVSLLLELRESTLPSLARVFVERGLIQVRLEDQVRYLRARYLLTKLDVDHLDIAFPVPRKDMGSTLHIRLLRLPDLQPLWARSWGDLSFADDVARLENLSGAAAKVPVLLDIEYQLSATDNEGGSWWYQRVQPPQLLGHIFLPELRWDVHLLEKRVPLLLGQYRRSPQVWKWQGWLLTPVTARTEADLEAWLFRDLPDTAAAAPAGTVFWTVDQEAVRLIQVPREYWLLVCSIVFLVLGIGLNYLSLRRAVWWLVLLGLTAGILILSVMVPDQLARVLYGIQPGVLILLVILLVQWFLHRRYRRQIVFLPSFTRLKSGSSVRPLGPVSQRDPTTVDALPPVKSSSSLNRPARSSSA